MQGTQSIGQEQINTEIRQGSCRDAILHSLGANASHGIRRTNADKRKAVEIMLEDEEWGQWSDREIARKCGVGNQLVSHVRSSHCVIHTVSNESRIYTTKHGTQATMNTASIGKEPSSTRQQTLDDTKLPPLYEDNLQNHQLLNASTSNEWYTPKCFLDAAHEVMGSIDLDPASNFFANEIVKAHTFYSIDDDGLTQRWYGKVWLNPPYGQHPDGGSNQALWSSRLVEAYLDGEVQEALLLVNAVPGNIWFSKLWGFPICFVSKRIRFYNESVEAGQPTHSATPMCHAQPLTWASIEVLSRIFL